MITRRTLLKWLAALGVTGAGLGGYALAEPFRLNVTTYAPKPPGWPAGLKLRLVVLADIHAVSPWMSAARIRHLVEAANALSGDAILLLGDFVVGYRLGRFGTPVPHIEWASALAHLKAPLGVHAVLGNHDWWEDAELQRGRSRSTPAGRALLAAGIPVYENRAVRLAKDGRPFWLAGLGDQWAYWPKPDNYDLFLKGGKRDYEGVDDLPATLAQVTDDAPLILMAHEPDIFPQVPQRVSLTLCGHTHGGQVRFAGFAPIVPSKFGGRYLYGHIVEDHRHLIVSGGLGMSGLPLRFGSIPEIVVVELG